MNVTIEQLSQQVTALDKKVGENQAALAPTLKMLTDAVKSLNEELVRLRDKKAECPSECNGKIENIKTRLEVVEASHNKITDGAAETIAAERERADTRMDKIRSDLDNAHNEDIREIWTRIWWIMGIGSLLAMAGIGIIIKHIVE